MLLMKKGLCAAQSTQPLRGFRLLNDQKDLYTKVTEVIPGLGVEALKDRMIPLPFLDFVFGWSLELLINLLRAKNFEGTGS
jgi:hypothetical protein